MAAKANQTTENNNSVSDFVHSLKDELRIKDCKAMIQLMQKHSGYKAKMWGPGIIGFGSVHYQYESGREGDMPVVSFAPRAKEFVFYFSSKFEKRSDLLKKLGKHKGDLRCIYIKTLSDIDTDVLGEMIERSAKYIKGFYPVGKDNF